MKITLSKLQEFIELSRDDELVGTDLTALMDKINQFFDNGPNEFTQHIPELKRLEGIFHGKKVLLSKHIPNDTIILGTGE